MGKVLIVDDSPMDLHLAGALAEAEGLTVSIAANGTRALDMLPQVRPDIVLTDLQMPEMDGLQLVEEMQKRFPATPVILMTAYGSEEIAVKALQAGAASYVPKRNLKRDVGPTLKRVLEIARCRKARSVVYEFLTAHDLRFELDYQPLGVFGLVGFLQDILQPLGLCSEGEMIRIGTAISEALSNAIDHGNLELESELRERDDDTYQKLAAERKEIEPYKNRRVRVSVSLRRDEAKFVVEDEGPGFDYHSLPDPTDPENLLKVSGRGLLLIRTFMDDVQFNDRGNAITMIKRRKSAA